jgi:uncharacterized damage-inducible protein DinB
MSTPAFLQGMLVQEKPIFVRVVQAVLEPGLGHRPDPKSRCSRDLIEHLIGHNLDIIELIDDGVVNHRNQVPFESVDAAAETLGETFDEIVDKLGRMDEGEWNEPADFRLGDHVIMEAPRQQLAWMLFLDSVHHRGQLTTHLRAMGSRVPSLYGPSADDDPGH